MYEVKEMVNLLLFCLEINHNELLVLFILFSCIVLPMQPNIMHSHTLENRRTSAPEVTRAHTPEALKTYDSGVNCTPAAEALHDHKAEASTALTHTKLPALAQPRERSAL